MLRWLAVNANVSVLYTQDYLNLASQGASFVDHSDHLYGALFAQVAASWAGITQLVPHVGYPVQDWPEDLNAADLSHKLGVWAVYSPRDDSAPDVPPCRDT